MRTGNRPPPRDSPHTPTADAAPPNTATAKPPPASTAPSKSPSTATPPSTAPSTNGNMLPSASHMNMRGEAAHHHGPPPAAPDHYFRFTDKHQQLLLAQARRQASALVVDTLYDTGKWKFLTEIKATSCLQASSETPLGAPAQRPLEIYELAPHAVHRVSCVAPKLASDPQQLAFRSHTMLAKTRVRGKLDDFMAWMSSKRRVVHQGMMNTLHDGHLQHCDVFSSFEAENPQNGKQLDQFAIKYCVMEPTVSSSAELMRANVANPLAASSSLASTASSVAMNAGASMSSTTKRSFGFLRRKATGEVAESAAKPPSREQMQMQQQQQQQRMAQSTAKIPEERIHICHGEYATIRHGIIRPSVASSGAGVPEDHRVGIITLHSIEDPELLQLCNSVAAKTTPRSVSQSTSRTQLQYSGIVAYPVASEEDDGAPYLEVLIKLSFFDPRGLTQQKKASMFNMIGAFRNLAHMMLVMRLRASPFLTATHWVADERRKCCLVCQQRFSSLRRRHHCRLCGEVTCSRCSAVHQVRLVREAKASLRICVMCVQGMDKAKFKKEYEDLELQTDETVDHQPQQIQMQHHTQAAIELSSETEAVARQEEDTAVEVQPEHESEPAFLLDFSLVKELTKPQSPTSTGTDTSSPVDPLMQSHNSSLSSTAESESNLVQSTFSAFHDSAYEMTFKNPSNRKVIPNDLASFHDSMADFTDDEEEEAEPPYDVLDEYSGEPVVDIDEEGHDEANDDEEEEEDEDDQRFGMSRIVPVDATEEDEEDKRLQCLLAYRLLDDGESRQGGVIPEDLTLQLIIKEAAQLLDCAIAAISFVDASRDMVTATYSASPLCQVSRGVIPKQHSLSWQVMERSLQQQTDSSSEAATTPSAGVVVLDTKKDPILKKSPFVLDEPYVRFMVGLPIRSWNGIPIGAMMIADIQPRSEVSASELSSLKSHVALVESWLENRREEVMMKSKIGASGGPSTNLEDRLAEMLCTSYKTTLQMRGMQQKQLPKKATTTTITSQHIQRELF